MSSTIQASATTVVEEPTSTALAEFAIDVASGLSSSAGKTLSPRYLYDELGSALFDAITLLPEYGLTRADQRLLEMYSPEIGRRCGALSCVAELGSGSGKKTVHVLRHVSRHADFSYAPIDVSSAALANCAREIGSLCRVTPICSDWMEGLGLLATQRPSSGPMLLLFLGSSIGNLDRSDLPEFLRAIRSSLRPGDFFLLGADLEKDVETMLRAYDDPTGVTAAFNLNLLGRMNRELGANFDLLSFRHEARWNASARRIEMHLVSLRDQVVSVPATEHQFRFTHGESIWTESSHKFRTRELSDLAHLTGFRRIAGWVDQDWPLTEVLWQAN
jgi:L-histidine Nalpha-methyltransferase